MISNRTLVKWRRDALKEREKAEKHIVDSHPSEAIAARIVHTLCGRILRLTQELMDHHLMRKS